jgi:hypothetical protein
MDTFGEKGEVTNLALLLKSLKITVILKSHFNVKYFYSLI